VRPLAGTAIAANLPEPAAAPPIPPAEKPDSDDKKGATIESILNGLFGG
jgi:hypothetical protein